MSSRPLDELYESFENDRAALLRRLELEQVPNVDRKLSPLVETYHDRKECEK